METATFNAPVPVYYPDGLAFFPPFLEGHGAFASHGVCASDQDLAQAYGPHPRFESQV